MDVTYDPPQGDDKQVVMNEVYMYWRARMISSGAGKGVSEACSTNFPVPEGKYGYSDYEEHRFLLEASVADTRALYAMLLARGVKPLEVS